MSTIPAQLKNACKKCTGPVPPTDKGSGSVSATCKLRYDDGSIGASTTGCTSTADIYDSNGTKETRETDYKYTANSNGSQVTVSAACTTVCGIQKGTPVWVGTPSS